MARHLLTVFLTAFTLAALLWNIERTPRLDAGQSFPLSAIGVLMVNGLLPLDAQMEGLRLWDLLDVDEDQFRGRLLEEYGEQNLRLFQDNIDRAWFCLHQIQPKETGTFRIHFTAFLFPQTGRREFVIEWIKKEVVRAFGEGNTEISSEDNVLLFTGSQPGQRLYLEEQPAFLAVSNSPEGWAEILRTREGSAPSISQRANYQDLENRLPKDPDLFLYFRGTALHSSIPEFVYAIFEEGGKVADVYFEAE